MDREGNRDSGSYKVPSNANTPSPTFRDPLASLADSFEIRDFDSHPTDCLTTLLEDVENENGEKCNNCENKKPLLTDSAEALRERRRHFSHGAISFRRGSRLDSITGNQSIDEDNTVLDFVQLDVLSEVADKSQKREWNEISRWIKYQQDIEEGSARLGKPHIAPMGHHFLTKLGKLINNHCIEFFDLVATDLQSIADVVVEKLISKNFIDADEANVLRKDLLLPHKLVVSDKEKALFTARRSFSQRRDSLLGAIPLTERRSSLQRKFVRRDSSIQDAIKSGSIPMEDIMVEITESPTRRDSRGRRGTAIFGIQFFSADELNLDDQEFFKAGPVFSPQAESTMIMVRGGYKKPEGALVLIRLADSLLLNDVTQFHIPTRFITIFLAPVGKEEVYIELGKTLGTLMSNRRFYKTAQTAKDSKTFLAAIKEFLDESIILPPGEWYNHIFHDLLPVHHLEEKCHMIRRQRNQSINRIPTAPFDGFGVSQIQQFEPIDEADAIPGPFVRTKKPFGGLINDIKRRLPYYKSDITEGLNAQTIAATIFLYFAAIAHNVTFGGLLAQKTKGMIGVPETLVAASLSGILFAVASGQPLNCIAPTGPLLVFDELLYKFTERHEIEFLPARVWIGLWVILIAIVVIGFEGSVLVKNITRFTMETFSALISVIFIYESMESLSHIYKEHPLIKQDFLYNETIVHDHDSGEKNENITDSAEVHSHPMGEPNTALLSTFLMFGTFIVAFKLKHLRTSTLFGAKIRNTLSDFGVPIGILVMVSIDFLIGDVYTTKIKVPSGLNPTSPLERGWMISPFGIKKPYDPWMPLICLPPGILVFFLMFMTVEICEKIIYQNQALRKGCGLHLDPLILAVTNFICGLFGLPWVSVATLKALAHIAALTVYSKNDAPGIPPTVIEIHETRVSGTVMSIFIGLSIFMSPVLALVPMCVLFGVFLYMGITSFMPTQLYERLLLLLTPVDSHPQTIYVRRVPTRKIHLYTGIQIFSLAALWAVKSVKQIALFFPIILMLLVPIRSSLKYLFTEQELEALDGAPTKPKPENDVPETQIGDKTD